MQVHWTDRTLDEKNASDSVVTGDLQRARLRGRGHRTRLTNQILRFYGLRLDDWSGSKYLLSDKKGSSVIVQDLGGLWPAAEKLIARPLDPLDPLLLEALKSYQRESGEKG